MWPATDASATVKVPCIIGKMPGAASSAALAVYRRGCRLVATAYQ